jgi:hypothetical protein
MDSRSLSYPTTLKTPSGDYKTQNFLETILFNEHVSNAAHVDLGLSL